EALLRRCLGIRQQGLGGDHPLTARAHLEVAFALHAQGRQAEALAQLESAARGYETARFRVGSRGFARAALSEEQATWQPLAAALAGAGRGADALRAVESGRARGLLDEARARRGAELTAEERRRREGLQQQLDRLGAPILGLAAKKDPADADRQKLRELL